ncbi:hypothetical protein ACWCPQ_29495 [Nocardia sp. NPDC001965]
MVARGDAPDPTRDRGREISGRQTIIAATQTPIYLRKTGSPWQRGTSENTDRLLRARISVGTSEVCYDDVENGP